MCFTKKAPSRVTNKNDKPVIFSQTAESPTKTTNRLFSKKSLGRARNKNDKPFNFKKKAPQQGHKQKRQTVYFQKNGRFTNKNGKPFIFKKKPPSRVTNKNDKPFIHSSFSIPHSAFSIGHSSFGIQVCVYACKETHSIFVSYCYQKLIKNGIQFSRVIFASKNYQKWFWRPK